MLTSLLNPSWKAADSELQLLDWERPLHRYEDVSGVGIPEDIKRAVMMSWAPAGVRSFLKMLPSDQAKEYRLPGQYLDL